MKSSDKHPQCKLYTPQCSNHGFLSQASWDYLPRKQIKKALSLCDTPLMSKSKLQLKTAVTYKAHVNQTKNTSVLSSYFHIVSQKFEVTSPCRGSACWACQFLERFGSMLLQIFVSSRNNSGGEQKTLAVGMSGEHWQIHHITVFSTLLLIIIQNTLWHRRANNLPWVFYYLQYHV